MNPNTQNQSLVVGVVVGAASGAIVGALSGLTSTLVGNTLLGLNLDYKDNAKAGALTSVLFGVAGAVVRHVAMRRGINVRPAAPTTPAGAP